MEGKQKALNQPEILSQLTWTSLAPYPVDQLNKLQEMMDMMEQKAPRMQRKLRACIVLDKPLSWAILEIYPQYIRIWTFKRLILYCEIILIWIKKKLKIMLQLEKGIAADACTEQLSPMREPQELIWIFWVGQYYVLRGWGDNCLTSRLSSQTLYCHLLASTYLLVSRIVGQGTVIHCHICIFEKVGFSYRYC